MRQAVRFADGVGELLKDPHHLLLEVGPGQTLSQLARQHPAKAANQVVLSSFAVGKEQPLEVNAMLAALGRLWLAGVEPDWKEFYRNERRHRIPLPTYPFERKRFWIEPAKVKADDSATAPAITLPGATPAAAGSQTEIPAGQPPTGAAPSRRERIVAILLTQLRELSGMAEADINPAVSFMDLGLDSLFLTQARQAFKNRFGVRISFRQLMEELTTLNDVAAYLDEKLPPEALPAAPTAGPVITTALVLSAAPAAEPQKAPPKGHGPFKPIDRGSKGGLTVLQQKHLDDLIARYTKRTTESKRLTQLNRPHLADPRTVAGFKLLWKEMVYPIVCNRSSGSKVWDVDAAAGLEPDEVRKSERGIGSMRSMQRGQFSSVEAADGPPAAIQNPPERAVRRP